MIKVIPTELNGLSKDSAADCFQIRSISEERLIKCLGTASEDILRNIRHGLKLVLSID
jgi:mRNA interferase MazF